MRKLPYKKKWYLLSQTEHAFFMALRQAVEGKFLVFAKVRLLDLLWLPEHMTNKQRLLDHVMSKHVDFVLCDRETVAPLLVVELDDPTHRRPERRSRDTFVDDVLEAAELPILRVTVRPVYPAEELAAQIQTAMARLSQE